jgi:hypothetical protein
MPALVVASLLALLVSPQDAGKTFPDGKWGGDHVGIEVDAKGVRFEFDCAHGTTAAIRFAGDGGFDVAGTFVRERPGPTRPEGDRNEAARYSGRIEGDTMTLTVETTNPAETIGTYTLQRGRLPRVRKCQ